jgi:hypothetical protein
MAEVVSNTDPSELSCAEIEQRLIGFQLKGDPWAVRAVLDYFPKYGEFEVPHDRIQAAIVALHEAGFAISWKTIAAKMAGDPGLAVLDRGGEHYLQTLALAAPAYSSEESFCRALEAERRTWLWAKTERRRRQADAILRERGVDALDEVKALLGEDGGSELTQPGPKVLSSADFVKGFVPPSYLWYGIIQFRFVYGLTAATGTGKTAIALRLLAHAALGQSLGGLEVEKCRALMLVGENADDVRARWIALGEQMGFFPEDIDVHFIPGTFSIPNFTAKLNAMAERVGGFGLVIVDTSAAYFDGDEENSNTQLGDHARALRALTTMKGNPCVVVNCHPTKNAGPENLLPRGGGAFLAEIDGNLTARNNEGAIELHWGGKFRGPDFEPVAFEMLKVTSDQLRDAKGRHLPTVIARPLTALEQSDKANAANADLQKMLAVMAANPGASIAVLAERAGWYFAGGKPAKSRVSRRLRELEVAGLAVKELGTWKLKPKGEAAAKSLAT